MALLVAAVPLAYIFWTDHVWEDFFITFRHSRNLANGHGLVYQPGERVHGFTSPIGALLPALFHWLCGADSFRPALTLFRAISLAAFAGGACFVILAMRTAGLGLIPRVLFTLLYAFEAKSIAFSTNGMETAFMLFFVGWSIYGFALGTKASCVWTGVGWAGLLWTRPDGCVYIAALAAGTLLFGDRRRLEQLRRLGFAALVAAAGYLPWFLGAWSYYGSPVPQTVRAKSVIGPSLDVLWNGSLAGYVDKASLIFSAIYPHHGPWPAWMDYCWVCLAVFATLYWLVPIQDRLGRFASVVFFVLAVYIASMGFPYPWYMPPIALCGLIALVGGSFAVARLARPIGRLATVTASAVCLLVVFESVCLSWYTAQQMRLQQREIEYGNRCRIGLWLAEHVTAHETVYLECLGYVGYFSNARMLDAGGLVAPSVVAARNQVGFGSARVAAALQPDWIVARPQECVELFAEPQIRQHYQMVTTFDVADRVRQLGGFFGVGYLYYDAVFVILRRNDGKLD